MTAFSLAIAAPDPPLPDGGRLPGETTIPSDPMPTPTLDESDVRSSSCPGYVTERVYTNDGLAETVGVPCDHDNPRCKELRDSFATEELAAYAVKPCPTDDFPSGPGHLFVNNVGWGDIGTARPSDIGLDNRCVYGFPSSGQSADGDAATAPGPPEDTLEDSPKRQAWQGQSSCPGFDTRVISKRDGSFEDVVSPCKHDAQRCAELRRATFSERGREDTNRKKPSRKPSRSKDVDPQEPGAPRGHYFSYGTPLPPPVPGWATYYPPYPTVYGYPNVSAHAYMSCGPGATASTASITNVNSNNVYTHFVSNVGNVNTVREEGTDSMDDPAAVEERKHMRKQAKRLRVQTKHQRESARMSSHPSGCGDYPGYLSPMPPASYYAPPGPPPSPNVYYPPAGQWHGATGGGGAMLNVNLTNGERPVSSLPSGFSSIQGKINGKYWNVYEEH